MEHIDLDLNPYKEENLYYAKGYDGFVTQDGTFYKTGKRSNYEAVHDYFAEAFVDHLYHENIYDIYSNYKNNHDEYKNLVFSAKDILINFYGLVNYQKLGNVLDITGPNNIYNGYSITDEQILLIEKLLILNNDKYESIYQLFDNKYNNYDLVKVKSLKKSK